MPGKKKRTSKAAASTSGGADGKPFLAASKITRLCKILGETNRESLQRADLEFAHETLSSCATEFESLLHGKKFNPDEMREWEENWTETLQKAVEEYESPYTEQEIQEFVKAVSDAIVTPPCLISYTVSGKHGSEIQYELFAFETREADGQTQKILANRYRFLSGYDEHESWSLTCRKKIEEECGFQEHFKNIEKFRVPEDFPSESADDREHRLFWSEDEGPGLATFNMTKDGNYKPFPLEQVLKEKPKWQIVVSMTMTEPYL